MIHIDSELFYKLTQESTVSSRDDGILESKHQKKIVDELEFEGFVTIKLISANKAGWPDILAIDKHGRAWMVEVKRVSAKSGVSRLQQVRLTQLKQNHAVVMVAWGYQDFLNKYKMLMSLRK